MKGNLWMLVVVVVFVAVFLSIGVNLGFEQATLPKYVDNETMTVEYSTEVSFTSANAVEYYDNETIRNDSYYELEEGTDYDFNTTTGNVTFYNTTHTSEGEAAFASYSYEARDAAAKNSSQVLSIFGPLFGLFIALVAVGTTLKTLGGGL
jgi:hypothetical protein